MIFGWMVYDLEVQDQPWHREVIYGGYEIISWKWNLCEVAQRMHPPTSFKV